MRDIELYRRVLGLEDPWRVERVELSTEGHRVDVWLGHTKGTRWRCPDCDGVYATASHSPEREWRHLDTCGFTTVLHGRVPRVDCPTHRVVQVRVPWAEPYSRFTSMFERFAIDVLLECNLTAAGRLLGLSWDEAMHIKERAVARGKARKALRVPAVLGVDEKAFGKGQDYMTIVSDLETGTVEHIAQERRTASLDSYFELFTPDELADLDAVAVDMWEPYTLSIRAHLSDADSKIVYDRYHIMAHMGAAVDTVRKTEHKTLRAAGDNTLTGSKYLWLYGYENLPESHQARFGALRAIELKTGRAWAIKESLRRVWDYRYRAWAEKYWSWWFFWATHCQLPAVVKVAKMIKNHLAGVMAFFKHRITSANAEGLNSRIQAIKVNARGFRNRDNFKTAVFFHCGGLDLYPTAA